MKKLWCLLLVVLVISGILFGDIVVTHASSVAGNSAGSNLLGMNNICIAWKLSGNRLYTHPPWLVSYS